MLRAMKVSSTALHGSIRFSFSRYNTEEEVDRIIEVFPDVVANSAACRRIGTRGQRTTVRGKAEGGRGRTRQMLDIRDSATCPLPPSALPLPPYAFPRPCGGFAGSSGLDYSIRFRA